MHLIVLSNDPATWTCFASAVVAKRVLCTIHPLGVHCQNLLKTKRALTLLM